MFKNAFKNFTKRLTKKIPIFSPESTWKILFNWLIIVLLILNISYMALLLIIKADPRNANNDDDLNAHFFLAITPKSLFFIEILINILTAYYDKGILIKSETLIIKNYFKKEFPLDFISIVVPTLLEFMFEFTNDFGKLAFLLRTIKLLLLFKKMEKHLHLNDKLNGIYEVFKLFLSVIFVDHILACAWVYLAQIELLYGYQTTWFSEKSLEAEGWQLKYLYSLYFSTTTMITVGYGDITPFSTIEIAYNLFQMIISSGMFAYTLNKFGNILQEMFKKDVEFKLKISYFQEKKHFLL